MHECDSFCACEFMLNRIEKQEKMNRKQSTNCTMRAHIVQLYVQRIHDRHAAQIHSLGPNVARLFLWWVGNAYVIHNTVHGSRWIELHSSRETTTKKKKKMLEHKHFLRLFATEEDGKSAASSSVCILGTATNSVDSHRRRKFKSCHKHIRHLNAFRTSS